jgi:NADH:ubiquinone oxidoreductase subunit 3 (subunit A)
MPSGWEIYIVLLISGGIALGLPMGLALLSRAILGSRPKAREDVEASTPTAPRINTRFFMAVHLMLLMVGFALLLIPVVASISQPSSSRIEPAVLIIVLSVSMGIGLAYSSAKGDLAWIKSFVKGGDE